MSGFGNGITSFSVTVEDDTSTKYRSCYVQVSGETEVSVLKMQIEMELGFPSTTQILTYKPIGGEMVVLDDSLPIGAYDVKPYDRLHLSTIEFEEQRAMRESAMHGAEPTAGKPGVSFAGDTATTTGSGGATSLPEAAQFVGLENKASTCYLNALVQVLFCTPEFREMVYRMPRRGAAPASSASAASPSSDAHASAVAASSSTSDRKNDVVFQLQALFARLQLATEKLVSTDALTTSFGWSSQETFVQHDVHEFQTKLLDNLEAKTAGVAPETLKYTVQELFRGQMQRVITCVHCKATRYREENYYDLSVPVLGHKDLTECLAEFVKFESVELTCEACGQRGAMTGYRLNHNSLPTILNIHLQRFSMTETGRRIKVNDVLLYPRFLQVDGMLDSVPTHPAPGEELYTEDECSMLTGADLATEVIGGGGPVYELSAVVSHIGGPEFGHYMAYIRDWADGQWYFFDDNSVVRASEAAVLQAAGSTAPRGSGTSTKPSFVKMGAPTPYLLVYRKRIVRYRDAGSAAVAAAASAAASATTRVGIVPSASVAAAGDAAASSSAVAVAQPYRVMVLAGQVPAVLPESIPDDVRTDLEALIEAKRKKAEEESMMEINVLRIRLSQKPFKVRMHKHAKLRELRERIRELLAEEARAEALAAAVEAARAAGRPEPDAQAFAHIGAPEFRLREAKAIDFRTPLRASGILEVNTHDASSLAALGLDIDHAIFVESSIRGEPLLEVKPESFYLVFRLFDTASKRTLDLFEEYWPKKTVVRDLKAYLTKKVLHDKINPINMVLFVEHTRAQMWSLGNDITLSEYQYGSYSWERFRLKDGAVMHIEVECATHFRGDEGLIGLGQHPAVSLTLAAWADQDKNITLSCEENDTSLAGRRGRAQEAAVAAAIAASNGALTGSDESVVAAGAAAAKAIDRFHHFVDVHVEKMKVGELKKKLASICDVGDNVHVLLSYRYSQTSDSLHPLNYDSDSLKFALGKYDVRGGVGVSVSVTSTVQNEYYTNLVFEIVGHGKARVLGSVRVKVTVFRGSQQLHESHYFVGEHTLFSELKQAISENCGVAPQSLLIGRMYSGRVETFSLSDADPLNRYWSIYPDVEMAAFVLPPNAVGPSSPTFARDYVVLACSEFDMWTASSSSGPRSLKTHKPFPMVLPKGCTVQMIREQLGQVLALPPDELTLGAVMYLYPTEKDLIMLYDYPDDAAAAAAAKGTNKSSGGGGSGAEGMEMVVYGTSAGGAPGGAGAPPSSKENACDDLDADVQLEPLFGGSRRHLPSHGHSGSPPPGDKPDADSVGGAEGGLSDDDDPGHDSLDDDADGADYQRLPYNEAPKKLAVQGDAGEPRPTPAAPRSSPEPEAQEPEQLPTPAPAEIQPTVGAAASSHEAGRRLGSRDSALRAANATLCTLKTFGLDERSSNLRIIFMHTRAHAPSGSGTAASTSSVANEFSAQSQASMRTARPEPTLSIRN